MNMAFLCVWVILVPYNFISHGALFSTEVLDISRLTQIPTKKPLKVTDT